MPDWAVMKGELGVRLETLLPTWAVGGIQLVMRRCGCKHEGHVEKKRPGTDDPADCLSFVDVSCRRHSFSEPLMRLHHARTGKRMRMRDSTAGAASASESETERRVEMPNAAGRVGWVVTLLTRRCHDAKKPARSVVFKWWTDHCSAATS